MAGFIIAVMLTLALGGFLLVFKGLFALILIGLPVFLVSLFVKRLRVLSSLVFNLFHSMAFGFGGAFGVVVIGYGLFGRPEMLFIVMPGLFLVLGSCFFTVHVLSIPETLRNALSGVPEQASGEETVEERQLDALKEIQAHRDQDGLLRRNDRHPRGKMGYGDERRG
jgi:thiol:disulfide interchange protein